MRKELNNQTAHPQKCNAISSLSLALEMNFPLNKEKEKMEVRRQHKQKYKAVPLKITLIISASRMSLGPIDALLGLYVSNCVAFYCRIFKVVFQ